MANDRILIDPAAMEQAIQKYQSARDHLQDAYTSMDNAKKHLDNCYKGPAYVVLSARLTSIYLNVKTAERGLDESIQGLRQNIEAWSTGETDNTGKSGNLGTGTVPLIS